MKIIKVFNNYIIFFFKLKLINRNPCFTRSQKVVVQSQKFQSRNQLLVRSGQSFGKWNMGDITIFHLSKKKKNCIVL